MQIYNQWQNTYLRIFLFVFVCVLFATNIFVNSLKLKSFKLSKGTKKPDIPLSGASLNWRGELGQSLDPQKQRLTCDQETFWFSEALRRSIENSLCTTENPPVQSILCFQGSKLRPKSPRQSRLPLLHGSSFFITNFVARSLREWRAL